MILTFVPEWFILGHPAAQEVPLDLSLGGIALLVLAAIVVTGFGPFLRWLYRRAEACYALCQVGCWFPPSTTASAEQRSYAEVLLPPVALF